ncbi:cell number regulator 10-like [Oryza brachyantha]|nr:cell number regulator 10-like [Oryza brachyantha]
MARQQPTPWSTGLFDCCDDCGVCCLTMVCPCITIGRVAEIVERGERTCCAAGVLYVLLGFVSSCLCQCAYSCSYRGKMRAEFGLLDEPCDDCCVHLFCEPCALCQEYRELKHHGFEPALGWHHQPAVPKPQRMARR